MSKQAYIPLEFVRTQVAQITAKLESLQRQTEKIATEIEHLKLTRSVLLELEKNAISQTADAPSLNAPQLASASAPDEEEKLLQLVIPDGRVATPIILDMIREQPGIKATDIYDALEKRVTKEGPKGPRKFLADLVWELGHRGKIRRDPEGGLHLEGGE